LNHDHGKPNILWLIKGFGLGGAEMLLPIALPYLDRESFDYRAGYFLPWKNALVPQLEAGGVPVTCFGITRHIDPRAVTRLVRHLRRHRIDLIHAHLPFTGVVARLAGKITGAKVVYTEHNLWGRLNPAMRLANRLTFGLNDHAIAVSQDVAKSMRGIDRSKLTVIDNGIDCARLAATPDQSAAVRAEFNIPTGDFLVGKVANLTPKKNHENLIEAFALLCRRHPAATLLLIGQTVDREPLLRRLANERGVGDKVLFAGARTDIPRLLRALDVFVMSSDFEGLPIALLEALSLARPVVATAVGGIPGVVRDGVDGSLVPPRDPQALAARLGELASSTDLRASMGASGQERVRSGYDISRMVTRVETIYRQVLAGEGR
jgi:glycosyltransferase involved in cell wall biosynthesis